MAVSQDIRVLRGVATHAQHTTLYFAWSAVLSQLLDLGLTDSPSTVEQQILQHSAAIPELVWLARLLNSALNTEFAATTLTAQMEFDRALPDTSTSLRSRLAIEVLGQVRRLASKNPGKSNNPLLECTSRVYTRLGQLHYLNTVKSAAYSPPFTA